MTEGKTPQTPNFLRLPCTRQLVRFLTLLVDIFVGGVDAGCVRTSPSKCGIDLTIYGSECRMYINVAHGHGHGHGHDKNQNRLTSRFYGIPNKVQLFMTDVCQA